MRSGLLRAAAVLCLCCIACCFREAPFHALSAAENPWRRRQAFAAGSRFGLTLLHRRLAAKRSSGGSSSAKEGLTVRADEKPSASRRKSAKTLASSSKKPPPAPPALPATTKTAARKTPAAKLTSRVAKPSKSQVAKPVEKEAIEPQEEEQILGTVTKEKGRVIQTLSVTTTPLPAKPKGKGKEKQPAVAAANGGDEEEDPALQPFAWYKEDRVARELDYVREITRDRYELIYMLAVLHHREILEGRMTDDFVQYNISDPKFPELFRNVTQGIRPFPWEGKSHVARRATTPPPAQKHESMSDLFDDLEDFRTGVEQFISGGPVSEKFLNATRLIDRRPIRREFEKFQP